jgi:hypothetical protein
VCHDTPEDEIEGHTVGGVSQCIFLYGRKLRSHDNSPKNEWTETDTSIAGEICLGASLDEGVWV